jgi:regulator of CtrA degradation
MTATAIHHDDAGRFAMKHLKNEDFNTLYRSVMAFVEETASYLDGRGRAEAKALPRGAAMDYAALTRELTNGIVRIANLMLSLRSVRDGEAALSATMFDIRTKGLRDSPEVPGSSGLDIGVQPQGLLDLILKFEELRLEIGDLTARLESVHEPVGNPVHNAMALINRTFGGRP